ncbi:MAG TPA: LysM peptidoglycan-binding domain-containing protein [bacterium]|nr:LysM peptidoglycan-binding domain-containing protein [bacterium]
MKNLLISLAFLFSLSLVAYEAPGSVEEVPVPPFIDVEKADFTQAPDEHEVTGGDTLWDLSEKYLKSPWYWPKVWSINPQIKNPHLIYPGDKVYFRGTGEIMMPPTNEGGLAIGGEGESSEDLETDETARTGKTLDDKPENYKNYVKLGGKYRVDRFTQIEDTVLDVPYRGYVADETLKQAGKIMAAFDTKELLATEDSCYVQFTGKKHAVGDYLEFFRVVEEITHPVTNDVVGNHIEITGKGKIIDINNDGIATVRIIKAYTAVQREDSVREFQERRPNIKVEQLDNKKLQTIVLSGYDPVTMFGDGYLIYLDKGAKEGLVEGNMLTIHRRQDGLDTLDDDDVAKLPLEPIGEVVVVLTEAHTSVAIITKSILGIERGDIATATIFE